MTDRDKQIDGLKKSLSQHKEQNLLLRKLLDTEIQSELCSFSTRMEYLRFMSEHTKNPFHKGTLEGRKAECERIKERFETLYQHYCEIFIKK